MLECKKASPSSLPLKFYSFQILLLFTTTACMTFLKHNRLHPHQEDGLRQIFVLTMEVLQEFSRRENLNAQMSSVFQRYLALANQVFSWNFLPPNYILSHVRVKTWLISWSGRMTCDLKSRCVPLTCVITCRLCCGGGGLSLLLRGELFLVWCGRY